MSAAKKKLSQSNPVEQIIAKMQDEDAAYRYPLPTSVSIIGRFVPVKLVKEFDHDGEFDPHKMQITVRDGQVPIEEMDVLLHETIHAIDHWMDLELTERQVRLLASGLIGVFQDNPDFAEFVTRPLKPTTF